MSLDRGSWSIGSDCEACVLLCRVYFRESQVNAFTTALDVGKLDAGTVLAESASPLSVDYLQTLRSFSYTHVKPPVYRSTLPSSASSLSHNGSRKGRPAGPGASVLPICYTAREASKTQKDVATCLYHPHLVLRFHLHKLDVRGFEGCHGSLVEVPPLACCAGSQEQPVDR